MNQSRSTNSKELHDQVFIFKVLNFPKLIEYLKRIEKVEVFWSLKESCNDELKVLLFYTLFF